MFLTIIPTQSLALSGLRWCCCQRLSPEVDVVVVDLVDVVVDLVYVVLGMFRSIHSHPKIVPPSQSPSASPSPPSRTNSPSALPTSTRT